MRILILNGPNLNLLGQREPDMYGSQTLADLENMARKHGQSLGLEVECYQSSHEGHLIDALHRARNRSQGVIFNPGGYSHTSVALRDAIAAIKIPVIEVHLTNIHGREEFRQHSITAGACAGQICGMGFLGYELAINALAKMLRVGAPVAIEAAPARPERAAEVREVVREAAREAQPAARPAEARESREAREAREEREDREGKRRRRGRRGGRGRRREQELEGGAREGEAEGAMTEESGAEREEIDVTERYANLKGVVVRRGLDVLAEEEEVEQAPIRAEGLVTFRDAPEVFQTAYSPTSSKDVEPPLAVTPGQKVSSPAPERRQQDPFAQREQAKAAAEEVAPVEEGVATEETAGEIMPELAATAGVELVVPEVAAETTAPAAEETPAAPEAPEAPAPEAGEEPVVTPETAAEADEAAPQAEEGTAEAAPARKRPRRRSSGTAARRRGGTRRKEDKESGPAGGGEGQGGE